MYWQRAYSKDWKNGNRVASHVDEDVEEVAMD